MKHVSILFIALVAFFGSVYAQEGYKVSDEATDFFLPNANGPDMAMADLDSTAKGYILVFTCNHCPYAMKYEDRIIALDKKYKVKGYPVVAVNPNDSAQYPDDGFEPMKQRAKEKGFTFPYLFDDSQGIAKIYGATRTPHVFVLQNDNGKLFVRYIGAIDDNWEDAAAVKEKYVEAAVDALLAGKTVPVSNTKAIGCTIKWKK